MHVDFIIMEEVDIPEIIGMIKQLYQEDPEGEIIKEEKIFQTIEELKQFPEKGTIIKFVIDAKIVGYSILIFYWSNEYGGNIVFIDELFTKTDHRNQGIATKFIHTLIEGKLTYLRDLKGVQLEVTPSNEKALNYYQKLGFNYLRNTNLFRKIV